MILIDNVVFLKNKFAAAWDMVKEAEAQDISEKVKVESARTGVETLSVQTEKGINYIHSRYDPVSEAEKIMAEYSDIEKDTHVFFYGVGMGYHIEWFIEKHPDVPFSVYEPEMDFFRLLTAEKKLESWNPKFLRNMYLGDSSETISKNLTHFVDVVKEKVMLIILPSYERIFTEKTRKFVAEFRNVVYTNAAYQYANVVFSKRQPINSIVNLTTTLKTPNILNEKPQSFQGKPAILVAAGPSLDLEYENLRYIKENGLAYIFSVGSAINSLIENGIYPDAACTYDGKEANHLVFSKVVERGITDIPLFYGSMVGYETVQKYPGPMMHFMVGGDYFSSFVLKRLNDTPVDFVNPAKSIAIITLQLLYKLGCNPIILAGQNFAYTQDRTYAQGMAFNNELSTTHMEQAIVVKDVEGNDVYTNRGLNSFREEMESHIAKLSDLEVINTTKGGARIKGTVYEPLEKLINERLQKQVVEKDWLTTLGNDYDLEHLIQQTQHLLSEQEKFIHLCDSFTNLFAEMKQNIEAFNSKSVGKCFVKFDKLFDRLQENKFYRLLLQPMNQLLFEAILKLFDEIRFQNDNFAKARKLINDFTSFLKNCESDMNTITPLIKNSYQEALLLEKERTTP
ncbi:motility associated factor glycosyltransferase family protein [Brevibacillus borstelensis]|uniref:motility associated factor glycosyltransferase family protein n=1 Tax=Brevibacillus borstelensis TaxID=45462 RepID=UPI000468E459|nr:6-hydroxymethylpterin diphosphokinase MptE-like protein [Brevibacillus borstelensis]